MVLGSNDPTLPSPQQTNAPNSNDLAAAIAELVASGQLGGGNSQQDKLLRMPIYYGQAYNGSGLAPTYTNVATAFQDFYHMSDQERLSLGRTMYSFGLISNPTDYDQIQARWNKAVQESAYFYEAGRKVSPYDTLGLMAGLSTGWRTPDGKNGLTNGAGGAKSVTNTASNVDIPNPTRAKAIITDIFKNELGRAPTSNEIKRYTSTLVGAAKSNPTVTTQTISQRADGSTSQSTVQSGGVDLGQVGTDKAKADPEWGSYQAATTYMNALLSAIGNP